MKSVALPVLQGRKKMSSNEKNGTHFAKEKQSQTIAKGWGGSAGDPKF